MAIEPNTTMKHGRIYEKFQSDLRNSLARSLGTFGILADTDTTRAHVLGLALQLEKLVGCGAAVASGSPMDPKQLDELRAVAVPGNCAEFEVETIIELLADRDHLVTRLARCAMELGLERGKAQRYRLRCPVLESDVIQSKVTPDQALAFALSLGLVGCDDELDDAQPWDGIWGMVRLRRPDSLAECDIVLFSDSRDSAQSIAHACRRLANAEKCPLDILEAMAATEVPT